MDVGQTLLTLLLPDAYPIRVRGVKFSFESVGFGFGVEGTEGLREKNTINASNRNIPTKASANTMETGSIIFILSFKNYFFFQK
jgi:hypothetical protein